MMVSSFFLRTEYAFQYAQAFFWVLQWGFKASFLQFLHILVGLFLGIFIFFCYRKGLFFLFDYIKAIIFKINVWF